MCVLFERIVFFECYTNMFTENNQQQNSTHVKCVYYIVLNVFLLKINGKNETKQSAFNESLSHTDQFIYTVYYTQRVCV